MRDPAVRIVLMPRYTALHGATDFFSSPFNVRAFEKVLLTVWKGNGIGATPADVQFYLLQSTDLGIWNAVGASFSPSSPATETTVSRDLDVEWARLKATVSGASPGITVWAVGTFVPRARSA